MPRSTVFIFLLFAIYTSTPIGAQSGEALPQVQSELDEGATSMLTPDTTGGSTTVLHSPRGYQALGNDFYDDREYGRAILAYERGLKLKPGDDALHNNLRYVRGEMGIDRPEIKEFFLVRWWRNLGAFFGVRLAKWIALVFWALAVAGATFWYLRRFDMAETRRFALLPLAGVFLALSLFFYLLGGSRAEYLAYDREAILVARTADLRVAPGADATLEDQLTEGIKLQILDTFDEYAKVSLEDGRQGWVPGEALERI